MVDKDVSALTERLLKKLLKAESSMTWTATRVSDTLWLDTVFSGLHIRMMMTVPASDPEFSRPHSIIGVGAGVQTKRQILITITDPSMRWGRRPVFKEWFEDERPGMELALALFRQIAGRVEFVWTMRDRKRRTYAECIANMAKLLP